LSSIVTYNSNKGAKILLFSCFLIFLQIYRSNYCRLFWRFLKIEHVTWCVCIILEKKVVFWEHFCYLDGTTIFFKSFSFFSSSKTATNPHQFVKPTCMWQMLLKKWRRHNIISFDTKTFYRDRGKLVSVVCCCCCCSYTSIFPTAMLGILKWWYNFRFSKML